MGKIEIHLASKFLVLPTSMTISMVILSRGRKLPRGPNRVKRGCYQFLQRPRHENTDRGFLFLFVHFGFLREPQKPEYPNSENITSLGFLYFLFVLFGCLEPQELECPASREHRPLWRFLLFNFGCLQVP
ncbi:uncharacterized protein LOC143033869 [Oratosquilla oratoria]|uniref:uncharacterized protein LOC143033869 n=1 Tax=Oratosquilla oratoria TaxID=337810 RepID=UPI003F760509